MQTKKILADRYYVTFDRHHWHLFEDVSEDDRSLFPQPEIACNRGENILTYKASYGQRVGLPGTRLSIDFVRAVVVGYQENTQRWLLGLHLAKDAEEKPVFRALVPWPPAPSSEYAPSVREAAHSLSMMLNSPLKVFGEKKLPNKTDDPSRSGVTGPLTPHSREKISAAEVVRHADSIKLPIEGESFTLSGGRGALLLKLSKAGGGGEAPAFNMVEFNHKNELLKLIPPTGLLGAFVKSNARSIPYAQVQNVEFRSLEREITIEVPTRQSKITEERLTRQHIWGVYLTLSDESLLLLQANFTHDAQLMQTRLAVAVGGNKFETNSAEGVRYLRQHLEEQEALEKHQSSTEAAAYVIAAALNLHLVKTMIEA